MTQPKSRVTRSLETVQRSHDFAEYFDTMKPKINGH